MLRADSDNKSIVISEAGEDNSSSESDKPNHNDRTHAKKNSLAQPAYGLGVMKPSDNEIDNSQYDYNQQDIGDTVSILPDQFSCDSNCRSLIDDINSMLGDNKSINESSNFQKFPFPPKKFPFPL
jgi:hypothetical protein